MDNNGQRTVLTGSGVASAALRRGVGRAARHAVPSPENGRRAGSGGRKRKNSNKVPMAVDTLGNLLALLVRPANEQERTQVGALARQVQRVMGERVGVASVDQDYTGPEPLAATAEEGIDLEVPLPAARRGFVLVPRRWVAERSFAWTSQQRVGFPPDGAVSSFSNMTTTSAVLAAFTALALPARAQTGKTTLSVGQGINFATGKVVTTVRKADLSFKYVPPPPTWSPDGKLIPVVDARGEKHDPNSRLSWR